MRSKQQTRCVAFSGRPASGRLRSTLVAACVIAAATLTTESLAQGDPPVRIIVHPSRTDRLTPNDVRAIYLKQKKFWEDGKAVVPINRTAGSETRELFSDKTFGQDSRRLANYWNQRYFEAGEFPPATLASEEAMIRFVGSNRNAIGYVSGEDVGDTVSVILVLP